ncbi:M20 family metallopeptidase [Persephonella sp.]
MERTEILSLDFLPDLKEELYRLISIPSHNDCINILNYLEDRIDFIKFDKQFVKDNEYNLIHLDNSKPVLLCTHVDTVPPISMKDPFKPREIDGKIFGRGASDTKGLIASLITALDLYRKNFNSSDIPVSLAFTVDEEQNSAMGSEKLLEKLDGISSALILEPTYGKICVSQMGTFEFELEIKTESFHGSEFEKGYNPVKVTFEIINRLEKELNRSINIIHFRSGSNHYVTPDKAKLLCEIKLFDGESVGEIERKIKEILEYFTDFSPIFNVVDVEPYLNFGKDGLLDILKEAHIRGVGKEGVEDVMPSWTDAANLHKKGINCIVFGYGNLALSHTDREYIEVEDLIRNTNVIYNLLVILSQSR